MQIERLSDIPTPMAGLALGIASLGACWETSGLFSGQAQLVAAMIATCLLFSIGLKFLRHPALLRQDLRHPVVGSVVPTFAMALMVVSMVTTGIVRDSLWLIAIAMHLGFLVVFAWNRLSQFELHHMVPSWFVPPVGIIVADVSSPGGAFAPLAQGLFWFGLGCYALMLPVMLNRLIFSEEVPDAAKPTIAILAAPASLSLAGYLTITPDPSVLIVVLLLGIAVLMTVVIYLAFFKLMRLPFSPAYAAFTFPMVIGATALFKVQALFVKWEVDPDTVGQIGALAKLELAVATLVVGYVAIRYALFYLARSQPQHSPLA